MPILKCYYYYLRVCTPRSLFHNKCLIKIHYLIYDFHRFDSVSISCLIESCCSISARKASCMDRDRWRGVGMERAKVLTMFNVNWIRWHRILLSGLGCFWTKRLIWTHGAETKQFMSIYVHWIHALPKRKSPGSFTCSFYECLPSSRCKKKWGKVQL